MIKGAFDTGVSNENTYVRPTTGLARFVLKDNNGKREIILI